MQRYGNGNAKMIIDLVWGWAVLASPVAFIAGFVWIRRAKELETPIEDIPTVGQWFAISLGVVGLSIGLVAIVVLAGFGHAGTASFLLFLVLAALLFGPFAYCIYTYKWINRIRRRLRAQRFGRPVE